MKQDDRYAEQLFARLQEWANCAEQVKAQHRSRSQSAEYCAVTPQIEALLPPGVSHLYTHQHRTLQEVLAGHSVTVATATASGKTYAMALPNQIRRLQSPDATQLVIAPTRALIEQWKERLATWNPEICVQTYTGDTPQEARATIRQNVQILISTPDMLHMAILPYHRGWGRFFSRLTDMIIDESHAYRGVFGSHFGLILRRLQRVVALYRRTPPTFLFGSATIGNPDEHAGSLLGKHVVSVTSSGAPSGGRLTVLWQPQDERNYVDEAAGLMTFFVMQGIRTILFGQARQTVERILRQVKAGLPSELTNRVMAYRAGYSKEQRRAIEQQLASGDLFGIVSTSALEIGIDLGDLDVSIIAGFPGSISSYLQQAGRAGRRTRSALSILVLREDALDQYFSTNPAMLLETPAERALVNIGNPFILPSHLLCAAFEAPLTQADMALFGPAAHGAILELVRQGKLSAHMGTYSLRYTSKSIAFQVNLRQAGQRLVIVADDRKIEETDIYHAVSECHPGAVYYSQGATYQVQHLDLQEGRIDVSAGERAFYTEPLIDTDVSIKHQSQHHQRHGAQIVSGSVLVTRKVKGYIKRNALSKHIQEKCELPEVLSVPLETQAFWIEVEDELIEALVSHYYDPMGALHAAEHALISLLPIYVLGDRRDIGGVSIFPSHPQTQCATIFLYDAYPGGTGQSQEAYRIFDRLATVTIDTLTKCTCINGCAKCILSPRCGSQNRPLSKTGAIFLLSHLRKIGE